MSLLIDFAENYDHIAQVHVHVNSSAVLPCPPYFPHFCLVQVMIQYGFVNQTWTVILVVVLHSWNYIRNKKEGVSHFMITDDFGKFANF